MLIPQDSAKAFKYQCQGQNSSRHNLKSYRLFKPYPKSFTGVSAKNKNKKTLSNQELKIVQYQDHGRLKGDPIKGTLCVDHGLRTEQSLQFILYFNF